MLEIVPLSLQGGVTAFCHLAKLPVSERESRLARAAELGFDAVVVDAAAQDLAVVAEQAADKGLKLLLDLAPGQVEELAEERPALGVAGFCCRDAHQLPAEEWRRLLASLRAPRRDLLCIAFTFGASPETIARLAGCGFDAAASSSCWWDFRAGWLDEDAVRIASLGAPLALPSPPGGKRNLDPTERQRALILAGHYAPLWMMDLGFATGLEADVVAINARRHAEPERFAGPPARLVSVPGAEIAILLRGDMVLAFNPDLGRPAEMPATAVLPAIGGAIALTSDPDRFKAGDMLRLQPGEARLFTLAPTPPIRRASRRSAVPGAELAASRRIAIERVEPSAAGTKRIAGEMLRVEADLVTDGHGKLAADLLWRPADKARWRRTAMAPIGNDRFAGAFPLARIGRHLFTIEAWRDPFATLLDDITKKRTAGVAADLEVEEAEAMLRTTESKALDPIRSELGHAGCAGDRLAVLYKPETGAAMRDERRDCVVHLAPTIPVEAERPAAGFASWYELFPRSQSGDPARHGTFADVAQRLPAIREMGFDVVYFPPINPIGRIHRKGRNNSLAATADDPGSPYAIGSYEGGHDAIHPMLGTLEDFHHLREAAERLGLEIALDFAIQCAPDHPWVVEHPEWFQWRPDGTIRYAENPPKRYEDIVNVDFFAPKAIPGLWNALRDVVRFWIDQGVKTFRVDNPHTKPLPFWEWLIEDVRARTPDVIFLAEAFTRPAMMYQLAKIGFSQSYSYFTWRNTKEELTSYFTELSQPPIADFFRPHLFVNTPDINPFFLQEGGRPAFLIRAALAATLSGLWGMYNGFELCEAMGLPGREEYLDSEKYEIRAWDWQQPGNIIAEITRLNRIRKANRALHSHRGLEFLNASDNDLLYYAKTSEEGRNRLLVAVNLDPRRVIEAEIEIPLWHFGLPDNASLEAEELMREEPVTWQGKRQRIRLDPADLPFAIWRLAP